MAEGDLPDALPPERAHVPCIISCPRDFPPLSEVFPPPLGHDCLARLFLRLFRQIGEKAEMDIGRLKVSDGRAQVTEQRAQRRCGRRIGEFAPLHAGRQRQAQPQAAGRGLHIALHTGDLSGQKDMGARKWGNELC